MNGSQTLEWFAGDNSDEKILINNAIRANSRAEPWQRSE